MGAALSPTAHRGVRRNRSTAPPPGVPLPKIRAPGSTLNDLTVRLADFPKIRDIGRGSFGVVYCARDLRNGCEVAVKVIDNDFTEEWDRIAFTREAEILAGVDHPTLLGFRGWVPLNESDPPAILTEFMPRGSLKNLLDLEAKHQSPPEWDSTRKFIALYGTAIGMLILHTNQIIHRDLKPENILLNDQFEPKVGDFGLSKVMPESSQAQQTICSGTPYYMAPEIWEGSDYSFPVDVYAFGILVYVAVTLTSEFPGAKAALAIGKRVMAGERPPIPESVGHNWKELITSCWDRGPENRPTFEQIVRKMCSEEFFDASIDRQAVLEYQRKTLPVEFHYKGPLSGTVSPSSSEKSS
jgi:myosin-5